MVRGMPELPTTSYAVLGLVAQLGSGSGYEIAQFAAQSIANFWPIAKSQVYGELSRLEELGFVEGSDVRQERLPDKRTYSITKEGRGALKSWLEESPHERDRIRSGFLVKMFFADKMKPATVFSMLERYRDGARQFGLELKSIVDMLDPMPEAVYQKATARLGLKTAEAAAEWAQETLNELKKLAKGKTR